MSPLLPPSTLGPHRAPAESARVAVFVVFAAHALLFASWTAHIPHVKAELGLDDAQLGLAIFGAPVGALLAVTASGRLLAAFGSRRVMQATLAGYCAAGVLVGLAGTQWGLFAALALWGAFQGALDVSMNTQAITVERALGRPAMSGFHCTWSLGGFAGAGIGAAAVGVGAGLAAQLALLGLALAAAAGFATTRLLPDAPAPSPAAAPGVTSGPARPGGVLRSPSVVVLGALGLACMFCEGAAADWSAVHLHDSLGASGAVAGLAFAGFSAVMVLFRLVGDRLMERFPPHRSVPLLAGISTVAFSLSLLVGSVASALLGWAALGVGLALIIPAVLSAAGRIPGIPAGSAVAAVSGLGWAGYVGGPPLVGFLADRTSLPSTLVLVPVLTAVVAVTAGLSPALRRAAASSA